MDITYKRRQIKRHWGIGELPSDKEDEDGGAVVETSIDQAMRERIDQSQPQKLYSWVE